MSGHQPMARHFTRKAHLQSSHLFQHFQSRKSFRHPHSSCRSSWMEETYSGNNSWDRWPMTGSSSRKSWNLKMHESKMWINQFDIQMGGSVAELHGISTLKKKKEPKQNTTKLHLLLGQLIQLGPLGLIMCGWWDLRLKMCRKGGEGAK